jgi:hypothetical protein
MKKRLILWYLILQASTVWAQSDTIDKIIMIPHPRSDDASNQSVQAPIERIGLSAYNMILLGGDLTYNTTISRATMDYLDHLFQLGDTNTLWCIGNHDLNNPEYIPEYTHRPTYYAYYIQHMTFLVLNTELDADGFVSSHITGDQLSFVQQVCDTITNSKYLILLHHRLLWMIGDENLAYLIDSVGESTRQLDTSNFNTVVFPLLQQVKAKGISVLCLGGDKAKTNILYSPEDSITCFASTMGPEFSDSVNHVIIFTYHHENDSLSWDFVRLKDVEDEFPPVTVDTGPAADRLFIGFNEATGELTIRAVNNFPERSTISIVDLSGRCLLTDRFNTVTSTYTCRIDHTGIFLVRIFTPNSVYSRKIVHW